MERVYAFVPPMDKRGFSIYFEGKRGFVIVPDGWKVHYCQPVEGMTNTYQVKVMYRELSFTATNGQLFVEVTASRSGKFHIVLGKLKGELTGTYKDESRSTSAHCEVYPDGEVVWRRLSG